MDIISHGLWGGIAFGRKNRKSYWWAFFIGMAPDLFSFGIYTAGTLLGIIEPSKAQRYGQNDMSQIPHFVSVLYNYTHSFIIFLTVFILVWILRRKPQWLLGAWGLHILVDIPSHAASFFPTPFLWPLSNYHVNGIYWGNPIIFFLNWGLILLAYGFWYWKSHGKRKNKKARKLSQK